MQVRRAADQSSQSPARVHRPAVAPIRTIAIPLALSPPTPLGPDALWRRAWGGNTTDSRRVGDLRSNQMAWSADHDTTPAFKTRKGYLSFFSRFPSMSKSCFWPPNSADPVPLSL